MALWHTGRFVKHPNKTVNRVVWLVVFTPRMTTDWMYLSYFMFSSKILLVFSCCFFYIQRTTFDLALIKCVLASQAVNTGWDRNSRLVNITYAPIGVQLRRTIDEYGVTIPMPCVCVTSLIKPQNAVMTSQYRVKSVHGDNGNCFFLIRMYAAEGDE